LQEIEKWTEIVPIGVHFYLAERELIDFYLAPRNMGKSLVPRLINELDLYEHNQMSLQGRHIYNFILNFIFRNKNTNCILSFNKFRLLP
jgi:hypothetical protein